MSGSDDFDLSLIPLPPSISPPPGLEAHGLSLSQEEDIEIEEPTTTTITEKVDEIDNLYKIEDYLFSEPNPTNPRQDAALDCDNKPDIAIETVGINYKYSDSDSDSLEDQKLVIVETPLLSQIHSQIKKEAIVSSSSEDEEIITEVKAKFIVGLTFEEINIQFYRDGIEKGLPLDLKSFFTFNYCRLCSVNFKDSDESELLARFHYKSDTHLRNTFDWLRKNKIKAPQPMREIEIRNSIKFWLQNCQNTLEKDNPVIDEIPDTFESLIAKFEVQKTPPQKKRDKLNKKSKKKKISPTRKSPMTEFHEPEYSDHSTDSFDEFYYQSSEEGDEEENKGADGDAYDPEHEPELIKPQYSDNGSSMCGSILSHSSPTEKTTVQTENTNRETKDMSLGSDFDDQEWSIKEQIRHNLNLDKMFQPLHCFLCEFQSTQNMIAKMHYRGKSHQINVDKWLNSQIEVLNPKKLDIMWFSIADNIITDHIKGFKIYDEESHYHSPSPSPRSNDDFSSFTKPKPLLLKRQSSPPLEACFESNPNIQPVLKRIRNDNHNNGGENENKSITERLRMFATTNFSQNQSSTQSPSTTFHEKKASTPSSSTDRIPYRSQPEESTNQRGTYRGRGRGRGDFKGRGRGRGHWDSKQQKYQDFNPDFQKRNQWSYDSDKVRKGSEPIKNYFTNCAICQVDLQSQAEADLHYLSDQHKGKMKRLLG